MLKTLFRSFISFAMPTMSVVILSGCAAAFLVGDIKPGASDMKQVEKAMGKPDMTWRNAQGKVIQAAYSNQPAGFVTYMVYFNDQGIATRVDQVMDLRHYMLVKNGMNGNQVHQILGPERSVEHYSGLRQIDWNYGYCSASGDRQIYSISFDDQTMLVNGAITTPDPLFTLGDNEEGWCVPYSSSNTYGR